MIIPFDRHTKNPILRLRNKQLVNEFIKERNPYTAHGYRNILYAYLNDNLDEMYEMARYAGLEQNEITEPINEFLDWIEEKQNKGKDIKEAEVLEHEV